MSKNDYSGPTPFEKLFDFLQLEEDERDSLSYEEAEEEQAYMEMLTGLIGAAAAADGPGEGEMQALPEFTRDTFAAGVMLPALSSFGTGHLVHTGALSGAGPGEEVVKEIPLRDFFGESVLEEHLRWAEPTVIIIKESKGKEKARYVAFAEVRGDAGGRGHGHGLRIVLAAPDGQTSEVTLNAHCPAAVFRGGNLPSDLSAVSPTLFLA